MSLGRVMIQGEVKNLKLIPIKIPPLVVYGFMVLECMELRILNVPILPYHYDNSDEYRFPWNSEDIP